MNRYLTLLSSLEKEAYVIEPNFGNNVLEDLKALRNSVVNGSYEPIPIANENEVILETRDNVAIIAIDGAMYKKDIGGLCYSVVSYDKIVKAIDIAEKNDSIDTILFRVDTAGGSVAGAEEVRERIKASAKKTILYAENLLASAGMWIFTACDEKYANKVTAIGSIGVVIYYKDAKGDNIKYITSKDAKNKVCDIKDKDCKDKTIARLNEYEDIFYNNLLEAYPDKTREKIREDFDNGATVMAEIAVKNGYLDKITSIRPLLNNLILNKNKEVTKPLENNNLASMPSVEEKIVNSTQEQGELMKQEKATAPVEEANSTEQVDAKMPDFDYEAYNKEIMAIAKDYSASIDTIEKMLTAKDVKDARIIALEEQNKQLAAKSGIGATVEPIQESNEKGKELFTEAELKQLREEA